MEDNKNECIALLLAGGKGSRLGALTQKTAKSAVPFGGKYRIIDFTLSNCVNSGIETVGVLTQYQPLALNEYLGNGSTWDLDRISGGLTILPPYKGTKSSDWYKGTANAVWQNLTFIERYLPENVLILSGDHIYKMDYARMLAYHRRQNADCTIACVDVPPETASRYGIVSVLPDGRIRKFCEKPDKPDSSRASMGVYIFKRQVLCDYLKRDDSDADSSHDFGRDIIPRMLSMGERMFSYAFEGYWKDVGTVESYWEANMDLLGKAPRFAPADSILSGGRPLPPHTVGKNASIRCAIISEGCGIDGYVENSVLFRGVKIAKGAVIRNSVLLDGVCVGEGAKVEYSILDSSVTVSRGAVCGRPQKDGARITVVGTGCVIRERERIPDGSDICNGEANRLQEPETVLSPVQTNREEAV